MKAKQASLPLRTEKPRWSHYIVGGWTGYSQYVHEDSVPLCTHEHKDPIPKDLMKELVDGYLPAFFSRHCLASDWREHPAGSDVIVYGTLGTGRNIKVDLWVRV